MSGASLPESLVQQASRALGRAMLRTQRPAAVLPNGRMHRLADLLIDGLSEKQLPRSFDRARLYAPDCAAVLAVNTFLPWQREVGAMPLCGWAGFDEMRFQVRCPTGLRGTPPHLDLLALRDDVALASTVRCSEYLTRRRSTVTRSYDRLLATTPGLEPWRGQLERLRATPDAFRWVDLGALVKYALALARTFPDRPARLLYLFWEPLDAEQFEVFRRHRRELATIVEATRDARIALVAQSVAALWKDWAERGTPQWLAPHVLRLQARYGVAVGDASAL